MSIIQKIQTSLKAPKGQTNTFGKYKYRSCEDIVEAVKPLLAEHDAHLNISDEIILVGERVYVKATARIMVEDKIISEASASAREPLTKKGMDEAQITGATSSYARKYALNGLLAIDDTKDADSHDNREQTVKAISNDQVTELSDLIDETNSDRAQFLKHFKCDLLANMPATTYKHAKAALEKKAEENKP